jgi:hypothetical protein
MATKVCAASDALVGHFLSPCVPFDFVTVADVWLLAEVEHRLSPLRSMPRGSAPVPCNREQVRVLVGQGELQPLGRCEHIFAESDTPLTVVGKTGRYTQASPLQLWRVAKRMRIAQSRENMVRVNFEGRHRFTNERRTTVVERRSAFAFSENMFDHQRAEFHLQP